jgi:hypothetical protein
VLVSAGDGTHTWETIRGLEQKQKLCHGFDMFVYLEDRDSPMKISFRLLTGRRLGSEKLSSCAPLSVKRQRVYIVKRVMDKFCN